MVNIKRLVGRFFVSLLLIFFLIGFIVTFSISQNVNIADIENTASEIATEILTKNIVDQIEKNSNESESVEDFRSFLLKECEDKETFSFEQINFSLSCEEIRKSDAEDIRESIKGGLSSEAKLQVSEEISSMMESLGIDRYIVILDITYWVFAILSLIMIFLLFLLSFHKYKFVIDIGIVGIITGLPFLAFLNLKISLKNSAVISALLNSIFRDILIYFLIVFIVGIVSLIIGIILKMSGRNIKQEKADKLKKVKRA